MRRICVALLFIGLSSLSFSQSIMDDIYNRYHGKNGFTSITIGPQLFQLIAYIDGDNPELKNLSENFSGIKILVSENREANFSSDVQSLIAKSNYHNIMEVVETGKKVNFYAKENNGKIVDLFLYAIDDQEEVILSITGIFSINDLAEIGKISSGECQSDHISLLKKLENN